MKDCENRDYSARQVRYSIITRIDAENTSGMLARGMFARVNVCKVNASKVQQISNTVGFLDCA